MRISDLVLLLFILIAFALYGRRKWKRTAIYVLLGTMVADLGGASVAAALHHFYPAVLDHLFWITPLGAIVGGIHGLSIKRSRFDKAFGLRDEG